MITFGVGGEETFLEMETQDEFILFRDHHPNYNGGRGEQCNKLRQKRYTYHLLQQYTANPRLKKVYSTHIGIFRTLNEKFVPAFI